MNFLEVKPHFSLCKHVRGLYCIVDRASWIKTLAPAGITVIQLRIKSSNPDFLKQEIKQAIYFAKQFNIALYVNDYWKLAIELGAYGVHLGQEDLLSADLEAIAKAQLKLGVSTHDYEELTKALAIQPSYIALGPIYFTTSKAMRFLPQGLEKVKHWCCLIGDIPLVAIGGIKQQHIKSLMDQGADAVAMISHVLNAKDPLQVARACVEESL